MTKFAEDCMLSSLSWTPVGGGLDVAQTGATRPNGCMSDHEVWAVCDKASARRRYGLILRKGASLRTPNVVVTRVMSNVDWPFGADMFDMVQWFPSRRKMLAAILDYS